MTIKGLPKNVMDFEYLVVKEVNGEFEFYAVCANGWAADEIAAGLENGYVVHNFRHKYRDDDGF